MVGRVGTESMQKGYKEQKLDLGTEWTSGLSWGHLSFLWQVKWGSGQHNRPKAGQATTSRVRGLNSDGGTISNRVLENIIEIDFTDQRMSHRGMENRPVVP